MSIRLFVLLFFPIFMMSPLDDGYADSFESTPSSAPASSATPVYADSWSGVTAAAATGYCLAKHPYQSNAPGPFTPDGCEKVGSPGIVGAIRRNYVHKRTTTKVDEGVRQTCQQACFELGKNYGQPSAGRALRQQLSDDHVITSGIGDMASLAKIDHDFHTGKKTVAGILSRANTYHESDVAQADFCCCHVTSQ
jgi:hypothetical protein